MRPMTGILTLGHGSLTAAEFVDLLASHAVASVVDVRSAPYSRFAPQFNREALQVTLHEAGIAYRFAGEYLGGRPRDPLCYFRGKVPEGKANYLELVNYQEVSRRDWYQRGVRRLEDVARQHSTAVFCSEEDPTRCHRHWLIARTLLQRGATVQHIRHSGALEDASSTEGRVQTLRGITQLDLFADEVRA